MRVSFSANEPNLGYFNAVADATSHIDVDKREIPSIPTP